MTGYARIEVHSINGRKREARDDVTKHFLIHKTASLTNLLSITQK